MHEDAFVPVLMAIIIASIQPVQNIPARIFAALHMRSIKKKSLRGFLGGKMVSGSLQGFNGLAAQVATDSGVLQLPAAAALRLAKRSAPRTLGTVQVPARGVAAGIKAAEAALSSGGSRKKKLLAIPLLLALGILVWRVPGAGPFLYAFALSVQPGNPTYLVHMQHRRGQWGDGFEGTSVIRREVLLKEENIRQPTMMVEFILASSRSTASISGYISEKVLQRPPFLCSQTFVNGHVMS